MEPSGFWSLFAETGEPLYWLLSRAREQLPQGVEEPAPDKAAPSGKEPRPEL